MADTIASLERQMAQAAIDLDFELARELRDRLNLMRGGADADDAAKADTSGLTRQQPGAMGLGSSRSRPTPPPGWKPPPRPDLMTNRTSPRKRSD